MPVPADGCPCERTPTDGHMASVRNAAGFRLSYVDFPPRCAGAGGIICAPEYERFECKRRLTMSPKRVDSTNQKRLQANAQAHRDGFQARLPWQEMVKINKDGDRICPPNVLVTRANEWLKANPCVKVKTCESIEVKGRLDGVVDTRKSSYFEADHCRRKMRNMYIRALRLWILPRSRDDPTDPQQFGYVNIVPTRSEYSVFDSFGETIRKFNVHLRKHPLPGRVINVESQEMKFHEWGVGVDPDESCWVESVKFNVSFLVVIRVFFEAGESAYEEIGCADFVPSCRDVGSQFATSEFEDFGSVVNKARCWISQQQDVRVTNIQSIDYKLLHGTSINDVDTQRSFYVESGMRTTRYLRVLRICFVKPFLGSPLKPEEPFQLNYVTFEPLMISSGGIIGIPLFQTMNETMKRAMAWLNHTPPELEVISAETVPVRMFSGNQYGNHEVTYTWNRGEQKEFWLLVLRIFVNGDFKVLPADLLPEADDKVSDSNCACALL